MDQFAITKNSKMSKTDAQIVVALARCNMNMLEASKKCFYHRNTIVNRIERIKEITGLDPRNFFDLGELYTIAIEILGDESELL